MNSNKYDELIILVQKYYQDTGIVPRIKDKILGISKSTINRKFGTWANFLLIAGLPALPKIKKEKKLTQHNIEKLCDICKEKFISNIRKERRFCSIKCSSFSRRKENFRSPENCLNKK
jgi:hypothetical protein